MLTQHLSGELAPKILVNAIAPGFFPSKMAKMLMSAGGRSGRCGAAVEAGGAISTIR